MRLKFLAISDAHLGEDTSLLSYSPGVEHVANVIREHLGSGDKAEVETLLLLGDIPERSHATPERMLETTHRFMEELDGAVDYRRAVYMPGNHDHVLWTGYCKGLHGEGAEYCITPPEGDLVVRDGIREDHNDAAEEILSIIFDSPSGPAWQEIKHDKRDVVFANPFYAEQFHGRTYVFAHGTHFRKEVVSPLWTKKVVDLMLADGLLGDVEFRAEKDVRDAKDMQELEQAVAPFMDGMLPPFENNPMSAMDEAGYLLAVLSSRFGLKRQSPDRSGLFSYKELPQVSEELIPRMTSGGEIQESSLELFQKHFLPHMLSYLGEYGYPRDELTFVYGDTHDGGWGELDLDGGENLRVYNTGGWVHYDVEDHPTCYLFAVDEEGQEYLLNVSFKEVNLNGNLLLRAVSDASESQRQKVSNTFDDLLLWVRQNTGS